MSRWVGKRVAKPGVTAATLAIAVLTLLTVGAEQAHAQRHPVHYFHSADMPPGAIGQGQLLRGGPLPGHFQPVEIKAPEGAKISLAVDGSFESSAETAVLAGMLIGQVYPLRVTNIPRKEGMEVYPTVEVINRLYPPRGLENLFPVPIHVTQEELECALAGQFVVRVIYLEDPNNRLPVTDRPDFQRYYEVQSDQDPLQAADRLGRPMAILRMGSRTPDVDPRTGLMVVASPPLKKLTKPAPPPPPNAGLEKPLTPPGRTSARNIPRVLPTGETAQGFSVQAAATTTR